MSIRRSIIIPAIIALGTAGLLGGAAAGAAATNPDTLYHAPPTAASATTTVPDTLYHAAPTAGPDTLYHA